MTQRAGEVRPIVGHPAPQRLLPIRFGAQEMVYLFVNDLARPLFGRLRDTALRIPTGIVLADPIGQRDGRQPGQFAQGVGALDRGRSAFRSAR